MTCDSALRFTCKIANNIFYISSFFFFKYCIYYFKQKKESTLGKSKNPINHSNKVNFGNMIGKRIQDNTVKTVARLKKSHLPTLVEKSTEVLFLNSLFSDHSFSE